MISARLWWILCLHDYTWYRVLRIALIRYQRSQILGTRCTHVYVAQGEHGQGLRNASEADTCWGGQVGGIDPSLISHCVGTGSSRKLDATSYIHIVCVRRKSAATHVATRIFMNFLPATSVYLINATAFSMCRAIIP